MAPRGVKRASSTGVAGKRAVAAVAKKCKTITSAIRHADLPQSIRSTLNDKMLMNVFGTYKDERIPFQNTLAGQVNTVLKSVQDGLQAKIVEAQKNKATQEAEAAKLVNTSTQLSAASEAASKAKADSEQALDDSHKALKAAKTALHDLETAVKNGGQKIASTTGKKEKLEGLITNFFSVVPVSEAFRGLSAQAASAGKFLESIDMEHEFIVCVVRTFSKLPASWGTFDKLVQEKLDGKLKVIAANFAAELQTTEAEKANNEAKIENAKAAIVTAEEKVKAAEEALNSASGAAKEAQVAAKGAAANAKAQQSLVDKATATLGEATEAITDFQNGALAAFTEVEALKAPPPPPAKPAEAEAPAASTIDEAMTAAPPREQRSTPSVLPSPGVLFSQAAQGMARAVGLSPRIAQSPR